MYSRRLAFSRSTNRLAALEAALRARGTTLLDLTVTNPTEPDLGLPTAGRAIAAALADPRVGRHEPAPLGLLEARMAVAAEYARRGVIVEPSSIALTASSSESYSYLFKLLCDPGDEVLVPEPSYPLFEYLAALEGVRTRPYRFAYDGRWHVDWSTLHADGARAIIAVNPNNPTGSFLDEKDLARLDQVAASHAQALVVDEVFTDYAFAPDPGAVRSVVGRPARALTFALGGLSKSCALPQLKLGWIVASGPARLADEAMARLDLIADTYLSVATPVQLALSQLFQIGATLRAGITARVTRNRDALDAALGTRSPCTLLPAEGGWSAILRVPAILSDEEWALRLLAEDAILVQPGYFFDLDLGACLVLSLLPDPARFDDAVSRLLARVAVLTT